MDVVTNTIAIRGPIDPVFDLITSARFWDRWHPATRSVGGVTERPYQLGDSIHEEGQIASLSFSVTWKVTEHARPSRTAIRSENPPATITYTFAEADGTTKFTRELQYEASLFEAMGWTRDATRAFMDKQSAEALEKLKALVETILAAESVGPATR
jgi:hypothetical protein